MISSNLTIRQAIEKDIHALAALMDELGYPTSVDEMQKRFENISGHPDYETFVALVGDDIVGMVGLSKNLLYEKNGCCVRVLALVVNQSHRGKGIGYALMEAAEAWAKQAGAYAMLLNSRRIEERKQAHLFYQKIGFEPLSVGFVKKIK